MRESTERDLAFRQVRRLAIPGAALIVLICVPYFAFLKTQGLFASRPWWCVLLVPFLAASPLVAFSMGRYWVHALVLDICLLVTFLAVAISAFD
jgi:hypothetical protein